MELEHVAPSLPKDKVSTALMFNGFRRVYFNPMMSNRKLRLLACASSWRDIMHIPAGGVGGWEALMRDFLTGDWPYILYLLCTMKNRDEVNPTIKMFHKKVQPSLTPL